jgi:hypothetical protein
MPPPITARCTYLCGSVRSRTTPGSPCAGAAPILALFLIVVARAVALRCGLSAKSTHVLALPSCHTLRFAAKKKHNHVPHGSTRAMSYRCQSEVAQDPAQLTTTRFVVDGVARARHHPCPSPRPARVSPTFVLCSVCSSSHTSRSSYTLAPTHCLAGPAAGAAPSSPPHTTPPHRQRLSNMFCEAHRDNPTTPCCAQHQLISACVCHHCETTRTAAQHRLEQLFQHPPSSGSQPPSSGSGDAANREWPP